MVFYGDDLCFVQKEPDHVFDFIRGKGFTIKETSAPDYFLGEYFEHVKVANTNNKIMTRISKTYVKRMMENLKSTFSFDYYKQHDVIPLTTSLRWTPLSFALIPRRCILEMHPRDVIGLHLSPLDIMYAKVVLSQY